MVVCNRTIYFDIFVLFLSLFRGWNDVGFHGSDEISTPNIDALAYNGVILNNYYSLPACTPSRAALLTGKYPIHTGMQHRVLLAAEPWGLGLDQKLLPEFLNEGGYTSHAVGKWHLGSFRREYTPIYRGFASHYGFWLGFHGYYNHTHSYKFPFGFYSGYDMRRNLDVDWAARGHYSTDLFTDEAVRIISRHDRRRPLFLYLSHSAPHAGDAARLFEAPDETVAKFRHIDDLERRVYAAMVSKLDDSVGEVVTALRDNDMLDNSIIIFMSDNGSPINSQSHHNSGSNYPLRGSKMTVWEGGNRVAAAVWSPLIKNPGRVSTQLMHVTDWLPTLYTLTGRDPSNLKNVDGLNVWNTISNDKPSPRKLMVYNIDEEIPHGAVRDGYWKYVAGEEVEDNISGWYGHTGRNVSFKYDVRAVLNSKVEIALSGYWTMKKIDALSKQTQRVNVSLSQFPNSLTPSRISALRSRAEVKCSTKPVVECRPLVSPCLFNLMDDPCERVNLANYHDDITQHLEDILERYQRSSIPPRNKAPDRKADPTHWNGVWANWMDEDHLVVSSGLNLSDYLVEIVVGSILIVTCLLILCFSSRICRSREKLTPQIPSIPS